MNSHLKEPLLNYKNINNPGYALLITGEWGVGKTHTILNYFSKENVYYVSLYGITSELDIHATILSAMYPSRKKHQKILDRLKNIDISAYGFKVGIGNILSATLSQKNNEIIKKDKIIIFDDLERCTMDINITLGAINRYIEHHECNVIAICNILELKQEISHSKEKIFGLTLAIEPNINQAIDVFTQNKKFSEIKEKLKPLLIETFKTSNVKSLRILKHAIEDCLHLYSILELKHKNNPECINELFSVFIATIYEARVGNITQEDLRDRMTTMRSNNFKNYFKENKSSYLTKDSLDKESEEESKIIKINKKYLTIPFGSLIISDNDLIDAVFNGRFNKNSICHSLDSTAYFLEERKAPNWVTIYNFRNIENDTLQKAIEDFNVEFEQRMIKKSGEMLHIFHIKFLMSFLKETTNNFETIERECIEYIDDLFQKGEIEPIELNTDIYSTNEAYSGYGYWVQKEYAEYVQRVKSHLNDARKAQFKAQRPSIQKNLLDLLENDIKQFCQLISTRHDVIGEYYNTPILAEISPRTFLEKWMLNKKAERKLVTYALINRFSNNQLATELSEEKQWLTDLIMVVDEKTSILSGFKRFDIEFLIPEELRRFLVP